MYGLKPVPFMTDCEMCGLERRTLYAGWHSDMDRDYFRSRFWDQMNHLEGGFASDNLKTEVN